MSEKLKEMIKKLFALKGRGPDAYSINCWCEVLVKFDIKDVAKACSAALQKPGFFEIKMVLDELVPNNEEIAYSEWESAMDSAKAGGKGDLSDATVKALSMAGGMTALRMADEFKRNAMKKEFLKIYKPDVNNEIKKFLEM